MKKVFQICVMIAAMLLALTGCASAPQQQAERNIDVWLDAYDLAGAALTVTETGSSGSPVASEYGSIGLLAAEGETIGDVLKSSDYAELTPVLEGDVFEGWMEYMEVVTVDKDGFETVTYQVLPEILYTTEELLALTVPDHAVMYVAKWQSIDAAEYFAEESWDEGTDSVGIALCANGGAMAFREADGTEYTARAYTYWPEAGQVLSEAMGTEYGAALIGMEKDSAKFTGWTLYEADSMLWTEEMGEEEGMECFSYNEQEEYGLYVLQENPVLYGENISTEQLCGISITGQNLYALANWE